MNKEEKDTDEKKTAATALPQGNTSSKAATAKRQRLPYIKPAIRVIEVKMENAFTTGSVLFLGGNNMLIEDWEDATLGSKDIDF